MRIKTLRVTLLLALVMVLIIPNVRMEEIAQPQPLDIRETAPEGTFLNPGEAPVLTETSYKSPEISISIETYRDEKSRSNIYVADIYVSSVLYLRRAMSNNKWKASTQRMDIMAKNNKAILAMTGDYSSLLDVGLVAFNGDIIRKSANQARENALILTDGRMVTSARKEMKVSEVLDDGIWHSFLFGPALLRDGQPIEKFVDKIRVANPRSILGYYEPGHYCFVLVDGRSGKSRGMTLTQASKFMFDLGCKEAYNLDGGQSAMLWFNGKLVNAAYKGGRPLKDIVYIGYPAE